MRRFSTREIMYCGLCGQDHPNTTAGCFNKKWEAAELEKVKVVCPSCDGRKTTNKPPWAPTNSLIMSTREYPCSTCVDVTTGESIGEIWVKLA